MSSETVVSSAKGRSALTRLLDFLGSMNLAITLLVALAIASAIGTILKQNQAYSDYIIKFGPFWFEVFKDLQLYDVYSAAWFLFLLGFLLTSTTVCVYRNGPGVIREMRSFRTRVQEKSLRATRHNADLDTSLGLDQLKPALETYLGSRGYRWRYEAQDGQTLMAARNGALGRLGYFFAHLSIVVICIGGLLDSRIGLKIDEMMGKLAVAPGGTPVRQAMETSSLEPGSMSFRGNIDIPEGRRANYLFLNVRDGYVIQKLPFDIEVKDFRIEHYKTGQPKSFESDIVIYDPERQEPLATTISVNHPLVYKGHSIYQASFADGGSKLAFRMWQIGGPRAGIYKDGEGAVFESLPFTYGGDEMQLELTNFRLFNINPVFDEKGNKDHKNFGPSFTYKLRNSAGQAIEYENYMSAVEFDGRWYFLSGMRRTPADPMQFLHIPADSKRSLNRFMALQAKLHDKKRVAEIAELAATNTMHVSAEQGGEMRQQLVESMVNLVGRFNESGFDGISEDIKVKAPADKQQAIFDAYMKVLQTMIAGLYGDVLTDEGITEPTEADWQFLDDAVSVINALPLYGGDIYLQLTSFRQIQSAGLQITRSPGKNVVYFGSAMLTLGVFLMFYVRQRRIWVLMKPSSSGGVDMLLAASAHRGTLDFEQEFAQVREDLTTKLPRRSSPAV